MSAPRRTLLLALLAVVLAVVALVVRRDRPPVDPDLGGGPPFAEEIGARIAGRIAPAPDPEWVEAARAVLGAGVLEAECGPYRVITDAPTSRWRWICEQIVPAIEPAYVERLGVEPVGTADGLVVLFATGSDFRRYVSERTGLAPGYAAFTRASRGIVAVALRKSPDTLAKTVAHEVAHLLHRRVFGPDMPAWLSEGLADAIGDTATRTGLSALADLSDAEPIAARVLAAIDNNEQRPLAELLSLSRAEFDRGVRSFDYEQSALLVRFLLLDPKRSAPFRDYLRLLASRTGNHRQQLESALGESLEAVDGDLQAWLRASFGST